MRHLKGLCRQIVSNWVIRLLCKLSLVWQERRLQVWYEAGTLPLQRVLAHMFNDHGVQRILLSNALDRTGTLNISHPQGESTNMDLIWLFWVLLL